MSAKNIAPPDLAGRTIIVTGGGQGIGEAYAHAFADAGCNIVVADINEENATKVAHDIAGNSDRAIATATDVADEAATLAMAQAALGSADFR